MLGDSKPRRLNIRVVAATNRHLAEMVAQGRFREDLFYRLNLITVRLPALRERADDIPDLARHFLALAEREGLPHKTLDADALKAMQRYRWPGNIRELENLVRRLAALTPHETISADLIEAELRPAADMAEPLPASDEQELGMAIERYLSRYFAGFGGALPPPGLYHRLLRELELPLVSAALGATRGNQIRAAELLGVNRNTLRKKIRDLDIPLVKGHR